MKRAVELIAIWTALAGGAVLIALVVMTCISIAGRALVFAGLRPIPGDYELVEAGIGFAVFAALPYCHLKRGHASVDLFKPAFGRFNRVLDAVIDLAILAVALLLTWRLTLGMFDKKSFFETTLVLQFEVWQGYALALVGAVAFCIVALWRAAETLGLVRGADTQ